jgi:hypothetical protein
MTVCLCRINSVVAAVLCLQDVYGPLPVPEQLKTANGTGAASFAFLEKELHFSPAH